ncbi:3-oxoacid CoA-transferase subunit B [Paracoccus saliphilus]|uniref:3-oxoacid CoA-transferase subunit B n=1 Tax=Paracoccus saliphilus TaxID=405559 RepID=A0AA45W2L3_9RHOB|nr:3-oxoacid CoA-transferase subunit B [Paracoccus saliphilus]WCR01467.1 3-oxoacid CoA-transferase subunit B [Paracoccus saliphilus]SIS69094.1 3-oxoadipate CoA-transferase, beta subunit [Paracoccus saliphilus]
MTPLSRNALARMVANHLPSESFVNLGIGAPTMVANALDASQGVILHSENGLLNVGPAPAEGEENHDLINAGKQPVTTLPGASFFDSSLSFSMMRGGHIDVAVLGAFQVSEDGDLANWNTGRDDGAPPAVGGAVDLAVGASQIWVMMEHTTRDGAPRIVSRCTMPLTAVGVVRRIFTNLCLITVTDAGLVVDAMIDDLELKDLQALTEATLTAAPALRTINSDGIVT